MFPFALNQACQFSGEYAIIKGRVGVGEFPFLFYLPHPLYDYLCALLVRELVFEMME